MNHLERLNDRRIIDIILDIEGYLKALDRTRPAARELRELRASYCTVLVERHPHVDAILEDWSFSLEDTRTYTEALIDAVRAEVWCPDERL